MAAWENRTLDASDDELGNLVGGQSEDDIDTESTAGMEFVKTMLHLMYTSTLSAKTFCVLMYLAGRAGIAEAKAYGLPPNSPSGHFMRKVKRQLGWMKKGKYMNMQVPCQGKHDLERSPQTVPVMPAHEQFYADMQEPNNPVPSMLQNMKDKDELPLAYHHHPVVQGAAPGVPVYPIAIYIDGVPYSQTDGVVGFWLMNLVDGRRWLVALVRKRNLCGCGCRGWCTFFHFFMFLRWSLEAFGVGTFPDARYDGPWVDQSDDYRKSMSGAAFGFLCACLYVKGDWMELGVTMGLPTWKDALRPCWGCNCYLANMFAVQGLSFENLVWAINNDQDYFDACDRCEHAVRLLCDADQKSVVSCLRYDKRPDGARGRALVRDLVINGCHLRANDRLEPSPRLLDIGALDHLDNFPLDIVFWRPSNETLTRHRNPLFSALLGVTPRRSLVVDVLHAINLGVLLIWCRKALWHMILSGAYGSSGTGHENIIAAVLVLRNNLMKFYSAYDRANPGSTLTRVADLTPSMLGEHSDQKLKTKGAETWGVALFALSELKARSGILGLDGERLAHAGDALVGMINIWRGHGWKIPRPKRQELLTNSPSHKAIL
jgi:hypothetical protein